jgi:serine/threonine protein kinase/formylglycine-generating enzyme required for sulfatase activity
VVDPDVTAEPERGSGAASTETQGESGVRPSAEPGGAPPVTLPGRYIDLGLAGSGGFGEVRRVRDTALDRVLVMKILHAKASSAPSIRRRFFAEVQITAQLQHPGIVPVHDHGELRDGRLWYTMKEVRGTTLATLFDELHASAEEGSFATTASGWTFRRLVDAIARIAQTLAYAHRAGVCHRDIKPANLMVGEFGEVLVMDWGLARRLASDDEDGEASDSAARAAELTHHGDVLGTPAYMPPEQARGARELHGPPSDVYALGAVLYHLLAGHPPYAGPAPQRVGRILEGPPPPIAEACRKGFTPPTELVRACESAMQRETADRCSAEQLATDIVAWLDGARKREEALGLLEEARRVSPEIARLRQSSERTLAQAGEILDGLRPSDPVATKRPAWELEERARGLGREAALLEAKWLQIVHGALSVDADLPEAHAMLAAHYRQALLEAERAHRGEDATRFEAMLRAHDRGQNAAFLRGEGALTLVSEPPGAEVTLYRFVPKDRRLVPTFERSLGRTPLSKVAVQRGSYVLHLQADGFAEVRHPVVIERDTHWDGVPPGGHESAPLALPPRGELAVDDVLIPAGWCWVGGDPEASDSLPGKRIWVDAFVMRRFAVTNAEYLVFLNALLAEGREQEALSACPRDPPSLSGAVSRTGGGLIFGRDPDGQFVLSGEEFGRRWQPDWPVVLIDWHGASAYARWLAAHTGEPWRLPSELEREKAARGVDGRVFPWGNQADPTFACVAESHLGVPMRVAVTEYPLDESPYGVRGLAGNTRDWGLEVWKREGPPVEDGRLVLAPAAADDPDFRTGRGGSWTSPLERSRSAMRFGNLPTDRREVTGVRVVRSA